jgi:1-acyl-sn-glycerol-3-phosphate acyltransferase
MAVHGPIVPQMPPRVAKGGNAFTRWLGLTALRLAGWRVTGNLPDREKLLVIAAPHTSNWDWVIALLALWAMGLRMNYLIKDTALWWPASILILGTGGIPVNRAEPAGMADSLAQRIRDADRIIMVITPEGTRSRVEHWKTGFLRIAAVSNLPVVQVSWDYPSRTVHLGPEAKLTGDTATDIAAIRQYYRQFTGGNPENQSP